MWIITKDRIAVVGWSWVGTKSVSLALCEKEVDLPQTFRLLDGDGKVYLEGKAGDDVDFEPLDELGYPSLGCVGIQYRENGVWKTL